MIYCDKITDKGLSYLKGIHTLNMDSCRKITDLGLSYISGVNTLDIEDCIGITSTGIASLNGLQKINMTGCNKDAITAARLRGLVFQASSKYLN
jgi:hypothetical protein